MFWAGGTEEASPWLWGTWSNWRSIQSELVSSQGYQENVNHDCLFRSWHRVSTKLSVERSYQCSLPLARCDGV